MTMVKHFIFYILSSALASAVMAVFGQVHNGGTMPGVGTMFSWVEHTADLPDPATIPVSTIIYDLERDVNCQNKSGIGWITAYDKFVSLDGSYVNPSWITSIAYSKLTGAPSLSAVATSGAYADLTGKPTIPTNNNQLTNGSNYLTSVDSSVFQTKYRTDTMRSNLYTSIAGKQTQLSGTGYLKFTGTTASYDNSVFLTGINSSQVTTALGYTPTNPNGTNLQYIAGDGSKITFPTLTSGTVTSLGVTSSDITVGGTSPITSSGTFTLTLPTINSNVGTFNNFTVTGKGLITAASNVSYLTGNQSISLSGDVSGTGTTAITTVLANSGVSAGTYTGPYTVDAKGRITTATNLSFNNAPSVTIQTVAASANGNQLSATKNVLINYSVTILTTVSLSGNATGYVVLEICSTNSATASDWIEVGRSASGQSGTLVIGLTLTQTGGGQIGAIVPAGYYRRLRSVNTAGTPTYTYNSGQEVTY